MHARLRMLCSTLNDHIYSYIHVVESPACSCGHFRENNKHFLVDCPLFINERAVMFNNLNELQFQVTISNLLYGNTEHSEQVNIKAFLIIQNYISATGRF